MAQQGQVFPLAGHGQDAMRWAYRYRLGRRGSRRVQSGGFASEQAAAEALERTLERMRREQGLVETPTLVEFVDVYLAQHEGEPETVEKLRWLLAKAVRVFGERGLSQLRSPAIAAWRMTIPAGHRFEATQALRQVLARAVNWGCSTSTRPRWASRTPKGVTRRNGRSSRGTSCTPSPTRSGRVTGQWCSSLRQPDSDQGSGWRSSTEMLIATRRWSTFDDAPKRPHQAAQDESERSRRSLAGERACRA